MSKTLPSALSSLPVLALADEVAQALSTGNVLLRAEPGAGKSTGLPLALLLQGAVGGRIILLEPRRLAARSVAERLAFHLGEPLGQRIGLRMRGETRVSAQTQLEVVTEGVLTRLLQEDPSLDGIALVIFDEFHERSLHADVGLALCLEVQQALRDDLRLLLMSATLQTDDIQTHLGAARQFHCSVRQHPVDIIWVGEQRDPLPQRIVGTVLRALAEQEGDVLAFLPGVAEINRTANLLQGRFDEGTVLHCLHSGVSAGEQRKATAPATAGVRRVILATSLAETSITIDGVRVVVDSGLERRGRLDSSTGAQRLETVMASQASATQRAGRAGRTTAGCCYRLWSEEGHARRAQHWQPEILRADLAPLLLELGLWGAAVADELPWLEPPPAAALSRAEDLLVSLGLWDSGQLTPQGRAAVALPVHPRLAHMLLWAASAGGLEQACRLAVWLEEPPRGASGVDLEAVLKRRLSATQQRRVSQLVQRLAPSSTAATSSAPSLAVLLAQAYPDWIAQRRPGTPGRLLLACGAGAVIDSEDPLAHSHWLVVAQLGGAGSQARVFKAVSLDMDELQRCCPELFASVSHLDWDERQQRVLAERRIMLGKLLIDSRPMSQISPDDRAAALLAGVRSQGLDCLPWTDDCREWQARVLRMRELGPAGAVNEFPAVDDESLLQQLESWLLPWLTGLGTMMSLRQLDLSRILHSLLEYPQQVMMDEWLPRRYTVPSGSKISLSYVQAGNPVLSVRLQEMLGCAENPTVAKGRIPLKVELLSPARRPVQITEDLANFWTSSYPAVRKEMAGRYPRHVWPDDPLAAKPTTHAKRRK
ncbi:ATP-dependent helicase HrpB [Granulosicoccus sp. 3-233]|uniref:ATP-dependent helicase HrpB n=1 Tax=Granulosicoccus sp. 3-233 TaxID=3417969 RepID=UPI003D32648F